MLQAFKSVLHENDETGFENEENDDEKDDGCWGVAVRGQVRPGSQVGSGRRVPAHLLEHNSYSTTLVVKF